MDKQRIPHGYVIHDIVLPLMEILEFDWNNQIAIFPDKKVYIFIKIQDEYEIHEYDIEKEIVSDKIVKKINNPLILFLAQPFPIIKKNSIN